MTVPSAPNRARDTPGCTSSQVPTNGCVASDGLILGGGGPGSGQGERCPAGTESGKGGTT